jgi:hypothetical protein
MAPGYLTRLPGRYRGWAKRLAAVEQEVQECRQLNLRLAELCDAMMELVLPAAQRDEARISEIVERYRLGSGDPTARRGDA